MKEPQPGDTAICSQCGGKIVYIGPHWDHPGEIKPKHPAIPMETTKHTVTVDLKKLRARMAPTPDTDLLWVLLEDQHLQVQQARERERIASETYDGQQQSYRELETLYQASQERALKVEADVAALRQAALAYVTSATYEDRERLRAELYVLATVDHAGTLLLSELTILRELADDLTRWRAAGGDSRDLSYVFETMDKIETMKAGGE